MTNKSKRKIFLIIITIAAGFSIYTYFLWNKPHKNIEDAAAIKINAVSLYNTFIKDSAKAKAVYLNNVIQVSGIVKAASLNLKNKQVILLETAISGAYINCTLEKKYLNFKTGDTISLKGICVGYIDGDEEMGIPGDIYLIRCLRV